MGANAQQAETPPPALVRAQNLLREVGQRKQQLEIDNARQQAEIASLTSRLRNAEREMAEVTASLAADRRSGRQLAGKLERSTAQYKKLQTSYDTLLAQAKETTRTLTTTRAENAVLTEALAATERSLTEAQTSNRELYRINTELLAHYGKKSAWSALLQRESLTGIAGVAVENTIEDYRRQMYDSELQLPDNPPAPSAVPHTR